MVSLRRAILAVAIASAMISRVALAQPGSSSSLTHTVIVTVPPRVKVQLASVSPSIKVGSVNSSTQGLSLSVSATQGWVLSVGSNASSVTHSSPVSWSLDPSSGFSALSPNDVSVASGTISTQSTEAMVFFRNSARGSQPLDDSSSPVVLTVTSP